MRIGAFLKEYRETKGISVEKVAQDTHITTKYIEALENSIYTDFPSEVYMKGYLKLYAEYLGIGGKQLDNLLHHFEYELRKWRQENKNVRDKNIKVSKRSWWRFFLILALLPIGVFLFLYHSGVLVAASEEEESSDKITLEVEAIKTLWVEVNSDGVVEWSMMYKGERRQWQANNLLRIKVEDGSGVSVKFNGKPLNFLSKINTPIEITCENTT